MCFGFFFADLPDVHELLDEGLILGRQPNLITSHYVSATVADLHQIELVILDGRSGQGRAHPAATTVFQTLVMNVSVCLHRGFF